VTIETTTNKALIGRLILAIVRASVRAANRSEPSDSGRVRTFGQDKLSFASVRLGHGFQDHRFQITHETTGG
jgi:hypothetical protein